MKFELFAEQKPEHLELWENKNHWNGPIYFCKEDNRLLVPKKQRYLGYTFNFANPNVPVILFSILISIPGIIILKRRFIKK